MSFASGSPPCRHVWLSFLSIAAIALLPCGLSASTPGVAFVAVAGDSNVSAYSTDGMHWGRGTLPLVQGWSDLDYGGGTFIAFAYGSDQAAWSHDGMIWTATTLPSAQHWRSAYYGAGKFIIVAANGIDLAISDDGVHWTAGRLPAIAKDGSRPHGSSSIAYGGGRFVVLNGSRHALVSRDAKVWHGVQLPATRMAWISLVFGNGTFVASDGEQAALSADGVNWNVVPFPVTAKWNYLTFGDGCFLATAFGVNECLRSNNGSDWVRVVLPKAPPASYWQRAAVSGNGSYLVMSVPGDQAIYSIDGIRWNFSTLPVKAFWNVCGK